MLVIGGWIPKKVAFHGSCYSRGYSQKFSVQVRVIAELGRFARSAFTLSSQVIVSRRHLIIQLLQEEKECVADSSIFYQWKKHLSSLCEKERMNPYEKQPTVKGETYGNLPESTSYRYSIRGPTILKPTHNSMDYVVFLTTPSTEVIVGDGLVYRNIRGNSLFMRFCWVLPFVGYSCIAYTSFSATQFIDFNGTRVTLYVNRETMSDYQSTSFFWSYFQLLARLYMIRISQTITGDDVSPKFRSLAIMFCLRTL